MFGINLGNLVVHLNADARGLQRTLGVVENGLKNTANKMQSLV